MFLLTVFQLFIPIIVLSRAYRHQHAAFTSIGPDRLPARNPTSVTKNVSNANKNAPVLWRLSAGSDPLASALDYNPKTRE